MVSLIRVYPRTISTSISEALSCEIQLARARLPKVLASCQHILEKLGSPFASPRRLCLLAVVLWIYAITPFTSE